MRILAIIPVRVHLWETSQHSLRRIITEGKLRKQWIPKDPDDALTVRGTLSGVIITLRSQSIQAWPLPWRSAWKSTELE